ncbi:MAG: flagellar basal body P-ring formation protein FlgA [bacterium]|nr:flagellar basal body P-ring formation protein FlgA [bacterium]
MKQLSLFLLLSLFACLAAAGADTLVLKDIATVSDNIVRIKDIALMDRPTRSRIGNLVIAVSPEPGKTDRIQKKEIYEKLVGNGSKSPQIKGAPSVKIVRKGTIVRPSFFKGIISDYIVKNSKWRDGVTVEIVSSKEIMVPETGVRWQLTPANGQDFFGNILFKARAFSKINNEQLYENWIVAKLKIVKRVAVSNRAIRKNEPIGENDLRWETREIDAFTKDAIFDRREIIGQKAGRIIRPNSVITTGLMGRRFLVHRGGTAILTATLNAVKATSTVKVLANGAYGDNVRVMNTASRKILSAVVKGKNKLEVIVE